MAERRLRQVCRRCRAINVGEQRTCLRCGAPLSPLPPAQRPQRGPAPAAVICHVCGTRVAAGNRFCTQCGARLA